MMLAPWVLLPVILALRGEGSVRQLAASSAVAIALMGAVNAVATLTACLAAAIWLASHRPNRLWLRFTAWWLACAALAVAWWVVALVLLGRISPTFLDFIESSGRHDPVDVADRDVARHRRVDTVRRAQRHRGGLAGDGVRRGARDDAGRGGRAGRAGDAHDARPRQARHHLARRHRAACARILGRPGISGGAPGSGVP